MIKEDNIAKHRLGVARKALKNIVNYKRDIYDDDTDVKITLKYLAERALEEMEKIK